MRKRIPARARCLLFVATSLGACVASGTGGRDSTTVENQPAAKATAGADSQRFELRTLQGGTLPVTLAEVRNDTQESCGDTTYSAVYVLRGNRWSSREVTGDDCEQPAEHHERSDSGTIVRWRDSIRFQYAGGGAITGELRGDSLVIEDGGPREVYLRAHQ